MATYKLRYTDCPVDPSPAFPHGLLVKRPMVKVSFPEYLPSFSCFAMVDTGADFTLFPMSLMPTLGIDPKAAKPGATVGVGSLGEALFLDVAIDIQDSLRLTVPVGFSKDLDKLGVGLLGQQGFFDRVAAGFDYRKGVFVLCTDDG